MQRGSALILSLLAGLIILGGIFYFSRTTLQQDQVSPKSGNNPTAYTNQQLGFEFKHPSELSVKEDSEEEFNKRGNGNFRKNFKGYVTYEPGKFIGAVVVLDKDLNYDTNPFTVWVFDNPNDLSIDEWYKNYWYYPFVWGDFTYNGKTTLAPKNEATISGKVGKSGIIDYQPGKPKFIYLSKDQKMYLFRIIGEIGEQILANFNFLSNQTTEVDKACKITGCSGQVCSDKEIMTTCEYKAEYGCYHNAKCERQTDGKCGWTQTEQLTKCLEEER